MAQPQAERLERALAWAEGHGRHRPGGRFRRFRALSVAGCLPSDACVACGMLLPHIRIFFSGSACCRCIFPGIRCTRSVLSDARRPFSWCVVAGCMVWDCVRSAACDALSVALHVALHVVCSKLSVARCPLDIVCCMLRCTLSVACCLLHVVGCMLRRTSCVACCVARRPLHVVCCTSCVACGVARRSRRACAQPVATRHAPGGAAGGARVVRTNGTCAASVAPKWEPAKWELVKWEPAVSSHRPVSGNRPS